MNKTDKRNQFADQIEAYRSDPDLLDLSGDVAFMRALRDQVTATITDPGTMDPTTVRMLSELCDGIGKLVSRYDAITNKTALTIPQFNQLQRELITFILTLSTDDRERCLSTLRSTFILGSGVPAALPEVTDEQ